MNETTSDLFMINEAVSPETILSVMRVCWLPKPASASSADSPGVVLSSLNVLLLIDVISADSLSPDSTQWSQRVNKSSFMSLFIQMCKG